MHPSFPIQISDQNALYILFEENDRIQSPNDHIKWSHVKQWGYTKLRLLADQWSKAWYDPPQGHLGFDTAPFVYSMSCWCSYINCTRFSTPASILQSGGDFSIAASLALLAISNSVAINWEVGFKYSLTLTIISTCLIKQQLQGFFYYHTLRHESRQL